MKVTRTSFEKGIIATGLTVDNGIPSANCGRYPESWALSSTTAQPRVSQAFTGASTFVAMSSYFRSDMTTLAGDHTLAKAIASNGVVYEIALTDNCTKIGYFVDTVLTDSYVLSTAFVLSTMNNWNQVILSFKFSAIGEGRILGIVGETGSSFEFSNLTTAPTASSYCVFAPWTSGGTSYLDDVAVNDNLGSNNTSYPASTLGTPVTFVETVTDDFFVSGVNTKPAEVITNVHDTAVAFCRCPVDNHLYYIVIRESFVNYCHIYKQHPDTKVITEITTVLSDSPTVGFETSELIWCDTLNRLVFVFGSIRTLDPITSSVSEYTLVDNVKIWFKPTIGWNPITKHLYVGGGTNAFAGFSLHDGLFAVYDKDYNVVRSVQKAGNGTPRHYFSQFVLDPGSSRVYLVSPAYSADPDTGASTVFSFPITETTFSGINLDVDDTQRSTGSESFHKMFMIPTETQVPGSEYRSLIVHSDAFIKVMPQPISDLGDLIATRNAVAAEQTYTYTPTITPSQLNTLDAAYNKKTHTLYIITEASTLIEIKILPISEGNQVIDVDDAVVYTLPDKPKTIYYDDFADSIIIGFENGQDSLRFNDVARNDIISAVANTDTKSIVSGNTGDTVNIKLFSNNLWDSLFPSDGMTAVNYQVPTIKGSVGVELGLYYDALEHPLETIDLIATPPPQAIEDSVLLRPNDSNDWDNDEHNELEFYFKSL